MIIMILYSTVCGKGYMWDRGSAGAGPGLRVHERGFEGPRVRD